MTAKQREGLHALVVDDEPLVTELLEDMLTAQGFAVTTALGGEAALRLARERPPDVVLSDTNMPGMDGVDLLMAFQADPTLKAVPFFLMSGNGQEEERALAAGALRFFCKPIQSLGALAQTLREAV